VWPSAELENWSPVEGYPVSQGEDIKSGQLGTVGASPSAAANNRPEIDFYFAFEVTTRRLGPLALGGAAISP
jgi:hypothetical protein